MSIDIQVVPPPNFPDPREPISAFARAPGNIMTAPEALGLPYHLDDVGPAVAIDYLKQIIAEADKGDAGKFSDAWCVEADRRWSGGREMWEAWSQVSAYVRPIDPPYMRSETAYWGEVTRKRLRTEAMRFFLYYAAGYQVRWMP